MAIKLSTNQQKRLEVFLGELLDMYKSGDYSKDEVVGAMTHLFVAAAMDQTNTLKSWLDSPVRRERWKEIVKSARRDT